MIADTFKPVDNDTYQAALALVNQISRRSRHFRSKKDRLLTDLYQVIEAVLTNNLMEPKNGNNNLYNEPDCNPAQPVTPHLAMPPAANAVLPSGRGARANGQASGRKNRGAGAGERAAISASAISADGGRVGEGGQVGGVGE